MRTPMKIKRKWSPHTPPSIPYPVPLQFSEGKKIAMLIFIFFFISKAGLQTI